MVRGNEQENNDGVTAETTSPVVDSSTTTFESYNHNAANNGCNNIKRLVVGNNGANNGSADVGGDGGYNDQLIHIVKPPSSVPNTSIDDEEIEEDVDLSIDDMCEVVLSFKCRYCHFLCQDKGTLTSHLKINHHRGRGKDAKNELLSSKATVNNVAESANDTNQVCVTKTLQEEESEPEDISALLKRKSDSDFESRVKKIEMPQIPSIPPTPEAFLVDEDSSTGLAIENQDQSHGLALSAGVEDPDQVEDVFLCAECDIVFASKDLCCRHMHDVHDLIQFSADFIQTEIISKKPEESSLLKRRKTRPPKHLTAEGGAIVPKRYRVSKEIFYTCSKCPTKFESNEVMKFHEQCHTKPQMDVADADSEDDPPLEKVPKFRFSCPVCESKGSDRMFQTWSVCSGHLWREHKIDCELYTCSVCKFKNPLITRVKEHEELHTREATYVCKICTRRFKQLKQLRSHEKYHKEKMTRLPPPKESRWYTPKECHICKRILSDAKCLKKHISAVHNKLKPYSCNICGHLTARKAELQLHVRQHTGEKPYKCPICPFATGDHNSLRKHKLRHSDQRPYACPYCDYRCIQSCAFKKHIVAVHPGQEVVFLCQLCSHASVNECLFAVHQKDHEEGRLPSEPRNSDSNSPEVQDNGSSDGPHPTLSLVGKSKKPTWMEEDSVDVIDTGGVTIPASPEPPEPQPTRNSEDKDINSTIGAIAPISNGKQNSDSESENASDLSTNSNDDNNVAAATPSDIIEEGTVVGHFNVPVTPTTPILQLGQTTYILLPPNTPLPFPSLIPNGSGATSTCSMPEVQIQLNANLPTSHSSSQLQLQSLEHCNNDSVNESTSEVLTTVSPGLEDRSNNCPLLDKESARALSPLINSSSSQLLEKLPQLDNLDLAEVINSCNQSSSNDESNSMFERFLGMTGI